MNAKARAARRTIRQRATANRLTTSTRRRPRSITTHLIAAGIDHDTAGHIAPALRNVAKRLGIQPAETARTRRTVRSGRHQQSRTVHRYTREQVAVLVAAYSPRKAEYKVAVARYALAA